MREQKIIATDMDGTFLNSKMEFDRVRFARLHQRMLRHGFRFVVASGNQYFQLKSFFKEYPDTIYLSENGALVRDTEQIYFKSAFPRHDAFRIIDTLIDLPQVAWVACGVKAAYVLRTASDKYITAMKQYYYRLELIDGPADIDDEILKIATHCPEEETLAYVNEYTRQFRGFAEPTSSGHGDIDIIQPGMHKARGLAELGEVLDVTPANMVAFGNGGNDIEMLQYVGTGVAVADADSDVLRVADQITGSSEDQGVLDFIDDLCAGQVTVSSDAPELADA